MPQPVTSTFKAFLFEPNFEASSWSSYRLLSTVDYKQQGRSKLEFSTEAPSSGAPEDYKIVTRNMRESRIPVIGKEKTNKKGDKLLSKRLSPLGPKVRPRGTPWACIANSMFLASPSTDIGGMINDPRLFWQGCTLSHLLKPCYFAGPLQPSVSGF